MRGIGWLGFLGAVACASAPPVNGGPRETGGTSDGARRSEAERATRDGGEGSPGSSGEGRSPTLDASAPGLTAPNLDAMTTLDSAAVVPGAATMPEGGAMQPFVSMPTAERTNSAPAPLVSSEGALSDVTAGEVLPEFELTHDWSGVMRAYCRGLLYCPQHDLDPPYQRLHFEQTEAPLEACLEHFDTEFFGAPEFENGQLTFDWERLENIASCRERVIHVGELIVPLTEPGSECRWDEQCKGGSCDTAVSCPSVCLEGLPGGSECDRNEDCADRSCQYGRCVEAHAPIFDLPLGAECSWTWDNAKYCAAGTRCSREQYCVEDREPGEPCDETHPFCTRGYICADDETGGMSCAKVSLLPLGAACSKPLIAVDGVLGVCDSVNIELCLDGACQRSAPGDAGDHCTSVDLDSTCNPGLYCEWGTNICRPVKALGETCRDANECRCVDGVCSELDCSER